MIEFQLIRLEFYMVRNLRNLRKVNLCCGISKMSIRICGISKNKNDTHEINNRIHTDFTCKLKNNVNNNNNNHNNFWNWFKRKKVTIKLNLLFNLNEYLWSCMSKWQRQVVDISFIVFDNYHWITKHSIQLYYDVKPK